MTLLRIGDVWEKKQKTLNESGREKLGSQKSCQHTQHAKIHSVLLQAKKKQPITKKPPLIDSPGLLPGVEWGCLISASAVPHRVIQDRGDVGKVQGAGCASLQVLVQSSWDCVKWLHRPVWRDHAQHAFRDLVVCEFRGDTWHAFSDSAITSTLAFSRRLFKWDLSHFVWWPPSFLVNLGDVDRISK